MTVPVIAVDGPAGVGKTSIGARLAVRLGFSFLISGMLYRAVGHLMPTDDDLSRLDELIASLDIRFDAGADPPRVLLNGDDVTEALGSEQCALRASEVAAMPEVRTGLLEKIRGFRRAPGLIAEGRDMASVVFPDAILKIYLDAPPEVRAQRRHRQLKQRGISGKIQTAEKRLADRDERDSSRMLAPLVVTDDAHVIDTSNRTIESIEDEIIKLFRIAFANHSE